MERRAIRAPLHFDAYEGELVWLMTVAGAAGLGRALQRDSVRGLRSAFWLRLLRLGRGWFGFVRLTGVQGTNWIDHRGRDRLRVVKL